MCGIAGAIGLGRDRTLTRTMIDALHHRGPDGAAICSTTLADLGACRLSIIDLTAGPQPICNEAGTLWIAFNGEIYNFRELRQMLLFRGHRFSTQTDTEVVLHLYEEFGPAGVEKLRGMYAFAIADDTSVFLCRDRVGIKPLYLCTLKNSSVVFASEIKALLQSPDVSTSINYRALADKLVLGHPCSTDTMFQDISLLPPGTYLEIRRNNDGLAITSTCYYSLNLAPNNSRDDCICTVAPIVASLLEEAVASHLVSDVPISVCLSGGLDSSILGAYTSRQKAAAVSTFSISDTVTNPDVTLARRSAKIIGAVHYEYIMSFEEFLAAIPGCVTASETWTSLFALPFYILCQKMSKLTKVCLNGEGADELFGGYPAFLAPPSARLQRLALGLERVQRLGVHPSQRAQQLIEQCQSAQTLAASAAASFEYHLTDQLTNFHLNVIDKYSMAASIEMRVPYLDQPLIDYVARLPAAVRCNYVMGITKHVLKRVALRFVPEVPVDAILRKKEGLPSAGLLCHRKLTQLCATAPDEYVDRHEFRSWVANDNDVSSNKRDLLLFDAFRYIFCVHRGVPPRGLSFHDLLQQWRPKPGDAQPAVTP